ncbi:MAG: nitroreductase family protein [bacterium]
MNNIFTRRSVRKFSDKEVEQEKIMNLLKAGMQAPSSMNQQSHEFIVVKDKETRVKLSEFKQGGKLVELCDFVIVVLGNESKMKAPVMWQQDLGCVSQNILLEAVNQGLGAVWLGCAPHEDRMSFVSNLFNLPEGVKPYCVLAVGYPLDTDANKFVDRFDESKVHFEKY